MIFHFLVKTTFDCSLLTTVEDTLVLFLHWLDNVNMMWITAQ